MTLAKFDDQYLLFAAFGCWTLVHVGPGSTYLMSPWCVRRTQKCDLQTDQLTDRQPPTFSCPSSSKPTMPKASVRTPPFFFIFRQNLGSERKNLTILIVFDNFVVNFLSRFTHFFLHFFWGQKADSADLFTLRMYVWLIHSFIHGIEFKGF